MTVAHGLRLLAAQRFPAVDACDRCLALSELTVVLCSVPILRGTPQHDERVAAADSGELDPTVPPTPPAPLKPPLSASCHGLAPTPGELVRAAAGVSAERATEIARRFAHWSGDGLRERCAQTGVAAACSCSVDYPDSLRGLTDPPPVLYIAGNARALDRCPDVAVGMVGTRHPTRVGREAARNIAMGIAQVGGLVVSGMALGVDGASHEGALAGRGTTVAVLASGADRPSPQSHEQLYHDIVLAGAAVSELPPGTRPARWTFPARNRIIAALSSAVIVVEAPLRSGALITVDHAHDLGVDVYAVPGSLASPSCAGSNRLLCEGGSGVVDGVEFMAPRLAVGQRPSGTTPPARPVDATQAVVHDLLVLGPHTRQELARSSSSLRPEQLEDALTDLELSGWVERSIDGRYRLAGRRAL